MKVKQRENEHIRLIEFEDGELKVKLRQIFNHPKDRWNSFEVLISAKSSLTVTEAKCLQILINKAIKTSEKATGQEQ